MPLRCRLHCSIQVYYGEDVLEGAIYAVLFANMKALRPFVNSNLIIGKNATHQMDSQVFLLSSHRNAYAFNTLLQFAQLHVLPDYQPRHSTWHTDLFYSLAKELLRRGVIRDSQPVCCIVRNSNTDMIFTAPAWAPETVTDD